MWNNIVFSIIKKALYAFGGGILAASYEAMTGNAGCLECMKQTILLTALGTGLIAGLKRLMAWKP